MKIEFENWNFGKLFRNEIFINNKYLTLKDEELKEKKKPNTWPSWWCIGGLPFENANPEYCKYTWIWNHLPLVTCFKYLATNIPPKRKRPHARNIIKPCTANTGRRSCSASAKPRISSTWAGLLFIAKCIFLSLKWSLYHLAPMAQTTFRGVVGSNRLSVRLYGGLSQPKFLAT